MKKKLFLLFTLFILSFYNTNAQNNYEVLLHTGKQEFPENARDYANIATISAQEILNGHYYRLLQFYQIPNQSELDVLNDNGIQLLEYIPNKTYLAAIPADFDLEKLVNLQVRSIVELSDDLKSSGFPFSKEAMYFSATARYCELRLCQSLEIGLKNIPSFQASFTMGSYRST